MATATASGEREATEGSRAAPSGARTLRILLYGTFLASTTFQQGIVPLLPVYTRQFGLSGLETGVLLASTALSSLAVSLPAGALSDRLGARRLTIIAGWLMVAGMVLQAVAPSFLALLVARLVFGVGYGVVWTAGLAWLAGTSPEGSGLGGTVAASGVGGIFGPLLAGSLAGLVGLAVPFYVGAGVFAVLTLCLHKLALPSPRPLAAREAGSFRQTAGGMANNCGILVACAAVVVAGMSWSVSYLLGPELMQAGGVSTTTIGLILSGAAAVFVIGSMAVGSFGQHAVRSRWILFGVAGTALAFLPGMLGSSVMAVTVMLCALAITRSVLWTVCYPLAAKGAESMGIGVGVVMGFVQSVWAVTSMLSPVVAGGLSGFLGAREIFGLTVVACFATLGGTVAFVNRHSLGARRARQSTAPARLPDRPAAPAPPEPPHRHQLGGTVAS